MTHQDLLDEWYSASMGEIYNWHDIGESIFKLCEP